MNTNTDIFIAHLVGEDCTQIIESSIRPIVGEKVQFRYNTYICINTEWIDEDDDMILHVYLAAYSTIEDIRLYHIQFYGDNGIEHKVYNAIVKARNKTMAKKILFEQYQVKTHVEQIKEIISIKELENQSDLFII